MVASRVIDSKRSRMAILLGYFLFVLIKRQNDEGIVELIVYVMFDGFFLI